MPHPSRFGLETKKVLRAISVLSFNRSLYKPTPPGTYTWFIIQKSLAWTLRVCPTPFLPPPPKRTFCGWFSNSKEPSWFTLSKAVPLAWTWDFSAHGNHCGCGTFPPHLRAPEARFTQNMYSTTRRKKIHRWKLLGTGTFSFPMNLCAWILEIVSEDLKLLPPKRSGSERVPRRDLDKRSMMCLGWILSSPATLIQPGTLPANVKGHLQPFYLLDRHQASCAAKTLA